MKWTNDRGDNVDDRRGSGGGITKGGRSCHYCLTNDRFQKESFWCERKYWILILFNQY